MYEYLSNSYMYSNTNNSIIIPKFVLIQFCNIIFILTSYCLFIFYICMNTILSIFSKIITDTELIFSTYTNISTSYPKIYHTLLKFKIL